MEHQVFVPVPSADVRAVLRDPARLARCVPGLQQDADTEAGPLSGRLKVRVGGHTVTYRGTLSVTEQDPDRFTLAGEGTEVRGSGTVKLSLALLLTGADGGTLLEFTAESAADGRAAAFAPDAAATAAHRLLDRAAGHLAALGSEVSDGPTGPSDADAHPDAVADLDADADSDSGREDPGPGFTEVTASVFDTEVPPPSLDPFLEGTFEGMADLGDLGGPPRPPAEAAHARRTMIGRSAEEVDHAPPRGRYAPVPAPTSASAGASLRWIAPAAAVAVASAVLLGRALRRRR
ncbi:SRPBCC domain-containing protein [Streptomyces sp. NBC_00193]|uniref:CoxG family protein n=1 Tax=unclassified Streptomyces TaxID=2593676 RepID=UPI0022524070|nr:MULTISPECIES: SRPBCC domain-containing protein [unclassified Streptomyces]MCX5123628.1 SRPBCC domain-containing protein [Streptomyces sp. NBC_00347]MCX5296962.1 SRPBCC domain-containing protein [Streptomyces sp. NBC_00193]